MYNTFMNYKTILNKLIKKVSFPLKDGEDLELALKSKLTKKELKLLKTLSGDELQASLNYSEDEYKRVEANLIKKLNQERVKQTLYVYGTKEGSN